MHFTIALLKGDGIGPEIADEALRVLQAVGGRFGHEFAFVETYAGGEAWERFGEHLPPSTIETCRSADAILKGPFGGPTDQLDHPKWKGVETTAILGLRREFDLFMNLRPVVVYPEIVSLSPLGGQSRFRQASRQRRRPQWASTRAISLPHATMVR